jgi:hypothetical protein
VAIANLPPPDVVIYNRPDIHDPGDAVQKIIAQNDYHVAARFKAFVIWTNTAGP